MNYSVPSHSVGLSWPWLFVFWGKDLVPYVHISYNDLVHLPPQLCLHPQFLEILLIHKFPCIRGNIPNVSLYLDYFAYHVLSQFLLFLQVNIAFFFVADCTDCSQQPEYLREELNWWRVLCGSEDSVHHSREVGQSNSNHGGPEAEEGRDFRPGMTLQGIHKWPTSSS